MAKPSDATQLDVANKQSIGVASTTNDRNYFEEPFGFIRLVRGADIYSQTVNPAANPTAADNNLTVQPGVVAKLTTYQMDEIPGSNGEAYGTYSTPGNTTSDRIVDWLVPQVFGFGYAASLTQFDNTPIALTDGAFQIDYTNGLVRFDPLNRPIDLGYALPLKITAYRYIGLKGVASGGGGASGAGSIVRQYAAGVGLLNPVYQRTDGLVDMASAASISTGRVLGIVTAIDNPSVGDVTITYLGDIGGFGGYTPGELILLGTAPGSIVAESDVGNLNYPDNPGNIVHEIGTIGPNNTLFVNTTRDFNEI